MDNIAFILKMSLSGSILFLVILLFRPLTKKVFSSSWNYYILVIVLFSFIVPMGSFVELPEELDYKLPIVQMEAFNNQSRELNMTELDREDIDEENNGSILQDNNKLEITNQSNIKEKSKGIYEILRKNIMLYIWLIGVCVFLIKEIFIYRFFYKKLKNLSTDITKEKIEDVLIKCKAELKVNKKIIIKECDYIKSPMITGIINPVITLPKMDQNDEKLEMVLSHELIHYKRKDLWIKIIALIVNMLNWFNPLTYMLRSSINIECELSLDECLVKNMDKLKRKYYGQIILELIEESERRSLIMGTALFKNRKEIENRLKKIMYFKKSKKSIVYISLISAIIFTFTSALTSTVVFASNGSKVKNSLVSTEFAVFVSEDGLYMSDLKENNTSILDKGDKIDEPLISRDGENVAYIKEGSLYICNINTKETQEVAKDIESYDFDSENNLIYSTKEPGISIYDTGAKKSSSLISNEYKYYNIKCDSKNKVYASKRYDYTEGGHLNSKSLGIISYDLSNKSEKVILEGKPLINNEIGEHPTNAQILESLGSTPNVAKISTDDKYLYIWNSPNSGSTASDINQFIVYDVINNRVIDFTGDNNGGNSEGIYGLHYEDNISQNPLNSDIVAVNEGIDRDMFENKNLGVADIKSNNFVKLIPEDQVSMTPCYSSDGKNILYSASNKLDSNATSSVYKDWENQPHNIYEINTESQKITQVTNGKYFDFMPKYLLNNEILFVRDDGGSFGLWKIKDGNETKLAASLNFKDKYINSWYYGHYDTEKVIDVFVK